MTQIPHVSIADIDAAIQTQPTAQPQTQQQPASELDRLLDKPLAPIKFSDGAYAVEDMGQCYRLAKHYLAAGMVPRGLEGRNQTETLGRVAIAIEFGQQFKWSPAQSLQSIMVVNGRPCLWGDGPMGVVLRSGKCLDFTGTIEGAGDERVAVFTATRAGGEIRTTHTGVRLGGPIVREVRFSVADAKKAGLWGKSGPWANYPERMLLYRARAFCLRDLFADALAGIGIAEEHDEFAIDRQAEKTKAVAEGPAKLEIHEG